MHDYIRLGGYIVYLIILYRLLAKVTIANKGQLYHSLVCIEKAQEVALKL